jgi:hypothetical protein
MAHTSEFSTGADEEKARQRAVYSSPHAKGMRRGLAAVQQELLQAPDPVIESFGVRPVYNEALYQAGRASALAILCRKE